MNFTIGVAEDHELPEGVDWVIVRSVHDDATLIVRRSKSTFDAGLGDVLSAAWRGSMAYNRDWSRPDLRVVV